MVFNASLTPVGLANLALIKIGSRNVIGSLSENSPEGRALSSWYKISLAQTLESFNWNFCRKRLLLEVHADDPPPDWGFRYKWDSSMLILRELYNPLGPNADAIPYTVEMSDDGSKSILTNLEDATMIYTRDVTDDSFVTLYPPSFINAFTSALAANIAFTITGSQAIAQAKQQEFVYFVRNAAGMDGNQVIADKPREAEAIRGRA